MSRKAQFDADAYWASRKRCRLCGGLTRFSQQTPTEVICASCEKREEARKRRQAETLKIIEQARCRDADFHARIRAAQEEVLENKGETGSVSIRDRMNSEIRAEMLTVQAAANQEYIRLGDEITPLLARLERLQNATIEEFSPRYDSKIIATGIIQGIGGMAGGFVTSLVILLWVWPLAMVILWAANALSGGALADLFPSGLSARVVWIFCLFAGLIIGFFSFLEGTQREGRENARKKQTDLLERQIQDCRRPREKTIADLEQRIAELRDNMVRISLTPNARKLIWERDKMICYLCGKKIKSWSGQYMHVDHLFPWSHGGSNAPENLRATHVRCNLQKSNRIIDEE